jgi:hypothetical protein
MADAKHSEGTERKREHNTNDKKSITCMVLFLLLLVYIGWRL